MSESNNFSKDGEFQWVQGTTKNGNSFVYGIKNGSTAESEANQAYSASVQENFYGVYWPVGDQKWKYTSSPISDKVGISRYKLFKGFNGSQVGDYCLEFTNTKGWGFTFKDESGDEYRMSTVVNRTHILRYNSKRPNIVDVA